jgi:hypothetical protein
MKEYPELDIKWAKTFENDLSPRYYHFIIAGAFIGCELAKLGLTQKAFKYSADWVLDKCVSLVDKHMPDHGMNLEQLLKFAKELMAHEVVSVAVPVACSMGYKELTRTEQQSQKTAILNQHGFGAQNAPRPSDEKIKEMGFTEEEYQQAVFERDFKWASDEYTYRLHQLGARFGTKECS